jgi:hypothetical protein
VGKTQLTFIIVAPADLVAEGDLLFAKHKAWMERTHHRDGDKALLSYTVSKAAEIENPMDPTSTPTGNTCFVLTEIYETPAGVQDHMEMAAQWSEFPALGAWLGKCKMSGVPTATVLQSLW